jgi:hypothetical protein
VRRQRVQRRRPSMRIAAARSEGSRNVRKLWAQTGRVATAALVPMAQSVVSTDDQSSCVNAILFIGASFGLRSVLRTT